MVAFRDENGWQLNEDDLNDMIMVYRVMLSMTATSLSAHVGGAGFSCLLLFDHLFLISE